MKIIRANHLGMCFGVRDAINLANKESEESAPTILGQLVHNQTVLDSLKERGVQIATHTDQVKSNTVMITAHGASEKRMQEVRRRGFNVIEATCPLVHTAHKALQKLVAKDCHPVIVGKRDHVEVRGMTEDLADYDVILSESDIHQLRPRSRFGVVSQTTQPTHRVHALVEALRNRFPESEVHFIDTVCHPTKKRQSAAEELALKADAVVVIGGANSNNTHELAQTTAVYGARVYKVQTANELKEEWFNRHDTVGITAGTSTPDSTIQEVESWLQALAVRESELAEA